MLFKVRWKNGSIFGVYSIKHNNDPEECQFLAHGKYGWVWVFARDCTPIQK